MIKKLFFIITLAFFPLIAMAQNFTYVNEDKISDAIRREAVERLGEEEVELEFYGGQTSFSFENVKQTKIMVSNAKFDELQNKFSAEVEIFADGKSAAKTTLQGKYYLLAEVWVPAVNINKGETITADNLKSIKIRSNRIKPQNLVEKDKLLKKEAKRNLREGKIVNDKDVGRVIMIKKGDVINSIYQNQAMQITAKAEALEDGCRGDKIEVRNTKSKKTFYGEVVDADTVKVELQ